MLQLRPNCECCDRDLPPHSTEALICSFECTLPRRLCARVLGHVCPNCSGALTPRPIRPAAMLAKYPAASERVLKGGGCPPKAA